MTLRKMGTAGWAPLLVLLITLLIGGPAGAVFDDYSPSPRARAMGGAFTALADDGCALFYNPAGLSQLTGYQLFTSYHRPYGLDFLEHIAASVTVPLPRYGVLGFGFQKLGVTYQGEDLESEKTFSFSHGFSVMEDVHSSLALGYALNLYDLEFGTSTQGQVLGSAQTMGVDLGIMAVLRKRTRMGAAIRNINRPRMGEGYREDLPQYMTFGIAYQPYPGVVTALDLAKRFGEDTRVNGGIEARIVPFMTLRFGVQTKPDRLMGGVGFKYQGIHFDYALINHTVLPLTHQMSISYHFGGN
ncbi:hypothetical protein KAX22_09285 [bacterium]|nr:hypothetical protein [bacterium]